jgi:hypothetical protein
MDPPLEESKELLGHCTGHVTIELALRREAVFAQASSALYPYLLWMQSSKKLPQRGSGTEPRVGGKKGRQPWVPETFLDLP